MAPQHLRHQASLESVLDLSATPPLSSDDKMWALLIFRNIVRHCQSYEQSNTNTSPRKYKRGTLLELVYEHAISNRGQDSILRYVLSAMTATAKENSHQDFSHVLSSLSDFEDKTPLEKKDIAQRMVGLADQLVDCFFLPFKASSAKTPQLTPQFTPQPRQVNEILVGTPQRLSSLRRECLIRDHHKCVISLCFDEAEALRRYQSDKHLAVDDDENLLKNTPTEHLDVAHIIPHAFASSGDDEILDETKKFPLQILDMFDPGVMQMVLGGNIDRAYNAITLTTGFHRRFGSLQIYFEATPSKHHTYQIISTQPLLKFQPQLPVTRTLLKTPEHTIDPPMPRLLAIHRACCRILNLSGAGEYIDKVLRDRDELTVMSDGSTQLGTLVELGIRKGTRHIDLSAIGY